MDHAQMVQTNIKFTSLSTIIAEQFSVVPCPSDIWYSVSLFKETRDPIQVRNFFPKLLHTDEKLASKKGKKSEMSNMKFEINLYQQNTEMT